MKLQRPLPSCIAIAPAEACVMQCTTSTPRQRPIKPPHVKSSGSLWEFFGPQIDRASPHGRSSLCPQLVQPGTLLSSGRDGSRQACGGCDETAIC